MRTLFYNCPAGICGDMHLGALVDLGADPDALLAELKKLPLEDWTISFSRDQRKGISGTRCDVRHADGHHHRTFADIRAIIEGSGLAAPVKADAIAVFRALAEAEGKVHGKPADAIHFHEVGAVDSILDIAGAAVCWHLLQVDRIAASAVELGSGTVRCAHGRMPVPAPATARLVENFQVTLGGAAFEATTPTGAALLAGKGCTFGTRIAGRQLACGTGIGQRDDPAIANVLHVALIESATVGTAGGDGGGGVIELATNLDDMPPEQVAFLAEELLAAGALDVWQTPATFKKGRLGCVVTALIQPSDRDRMIELFFRHSTTLGVRWRAWERAILERGIVERDTPLGKVRVKQALRDGVVLRAKTEHDDLCRLARAHGLSLNEIHQRLRD